MSESNGPLFALVIGLFNGSIRTLIFAGVTYFLLDRLFPDRPGRFGAYCVAIGFAIGHFSYSNYGPRSVEDLQAFAEVVGAALALWFLWWRWFARSNDVSDSDPM